MRALGLAAEVRATPSLAADLEAVAELAAAGGEGGLVVMYGDIVTHGEALAGLLADPRVATGVLAGGRRRPMAFRVRARRGRVISAASPYHAVHRPTAAFLGALKVAPPTSPALARVAARARAARRRAARVVAGGARAQGGDVARSALARAAAARRGRRRHRRRPTAIDEDEPASPRSSCSPTRTRRACATGSPPRPDDAAALLLVGLVRGGAHVGGSHLRRLFWARPLSRAGRRRGRARHPGHRRGPGAARLGGQGQRRLLHHLLRQPLLALHRALGGAPRLHARTRSRPSRC